MEAWAVGMCLGRRHGVEDSGAQHVFFDKVAQHKDEGHCFHASLATQQRSSFACCQTLVWSCSVCKVTTHSLVETGGRL